MLLIVPESFDGSHLPSVSIEHLPVCKLSASPDIWPAVEVVRTLARNCERVAITACTDPVTVSAMLDACCVTGDRDCAQILYADSPLVPEMVVDMPLDLRILVVRLLPSDLLVIPSALLLELPAELNIADAVLSTVPGFDSLSRRPVAIDRFPTAGPGAPVGDASTLRTAVRESSASLRITDMECCCLEAGVLLLWDHLDESHTTSQSLEGRGTPKTADYWHGIMHRREPDAGNAAYWFRRVGAHPAFELLASGLNHCLSSLGASAEHCDLAGRSLLTNQRFNPFAMLELSQSAMNAPGSLEDETVRMVQYLEILNLLNWSCRVR